MPRETDTDLTARKVEGRDLCLIDLKPDEFLINVAGGVVVADRATAETIATWLRARLDMDPEARHG